MWMMTTRGFYSAVAHRDKPDTMLIRARVEEDLLNLLPILTSYVGPWEDTSADYLWRLECSSEEWASACAYLALDVDYDNFKNSVKSAPHKNAYMRVWSALLMGLQGTRNPVMSNHEWNKLDEFEDIECEEMTDEDFDALMRGIPESEEEMVKRLQDDEYLGKLLDDREGWNE